LTTIWPVQDAALPISLSLFPSFQNFIGLGGGVGLTRIFVRFLWISCILH